MKNYSIQREQKKQDKYLRSLKLERELHRAIKAAAPDILISKSFESTKDHLQHGNITVNKHCMNVAKTSIRINRALGINCEEIQLIRGALLHDYFLYDWHEIDLERPHRMHGFIHARRALENAEKEYDLTEIEREIIIKHMWPLNPALPKCREAWVVTTADKWCSFLETVHIYKGHGKRISKLQI